MRTWIHDTNNESPWSWSDKEKKDKSEENKKKWLQKYNQKI